MCNGQDIPPQTNLGIELIEIEVLRVIGIIRTSQRTDDTARQLYIGIAISIVMIRRKRAKFIIQI